MAEARSAVLVSRNKRGFLLGYDKDDDAVQVTLTIPLPRHILRWTLRGLYNWRNSFVNFLFPARPWMMLLVMGIVITVVMSADPKSWWRTGWLAEMLWWIDERFGFFYFPLYPRIAILAAEGAFFGFLILMYLQRLLLRMLLSWRGWLYQAPKSRSKLVMVWGFLVQLLSGNKPLTLSFQQSLPSLPVPSARSTVRKYLASVRPLLEDEAYAKAEQDAAEFLRKHATKLNMLLTLKSWVKENYVTDWWETYVYHRGRDSIMINSNYYIMDSARGVPTTNPIARAANLVYQMFYFKKLLDHETLEPLRVRNTVPLCMKQYERMFGGCRRPGKECDSIMHRKTSKHIVVMVRGHFYRLEVFHRRTNTMLTKIELEAQLQEIADDAKSRPVDDAVRCLPAMTAENRTRWAEVREAEFGEGINRLSLGVIEKAVLVLTLDDASPTDWSERGRLLLHGTGTTRWFDKTLNLVVFANGHAGLNAEHSWADAPAVAHMMEWVLTGEFIGECYDQDGFNRVVGPQPHRSLPVPKLLPWDLSDTAKDAIHAAVLRAEESIADLDLAVFTHAKYGKGFMKSCGVSPDAYIQLALQMAYYRDAGKFALTYEASMTRLFRAGRTETVRSLTDESCEFVRAMVDDDAMSLEDKVMLFRRAADRHVQNYRDAMSGQGVDRHLFALYVVGKGTGVESQFLNDALSMKWSLSTSQQPQQQTTRWKTVAPRVNELSWWDAESQERIKPEMMNIFSPGGGFGPVDEEGYGVSYMIAGEELLYFHVSSKRSSKATDSKRFKLQVLQAFNELHELFAAATDEETS